jgi:O-acetylhomoserine (thiol)-lyase
LTASLGSTESLVVAPQMMRGRDLTQEQLRISAVTEGTVRLSVGLEDVDDLLEDVTQALVAAAGAG